MTARPWLLLAFCCALWTPTRVRAQDQTIPKPAHGKKKAKKSYDYDQSEYKAYHALDGSGASHYRFDKDGNPIEQAAPKKMAKARRKKKSAQAGAAATASAAPVEFAHAHFPGSVASPEAPPASGAPRSDGTASGSAPVVGGACQGDTCSQPPAGQ